MNIQNIRTNRAEKLRRLGDLIAGYWRQKHPKKTAHHLAERCGVRIRQAEKWISGLAPTTAHIAHMLATEGRPFLARVIRPFVRAYETAQRPKRGRLARAAATLAQKLSHKAEAL